MASRSLDSQFSHVRFRERITDVTDIVQTTFENSKSTMWNNVDFWGRIKKFAIHVIGTKRNIGEIFLTSSQGSVTWNLKVEVMLRRRQTHRAMFHKLRWCEEMMQYITKTGKIYSAALFKNINIYAVIYITVFSTESTSLTWTYMDPMDYNENGET